MAKHLNYGRRSMLELRDELYGYIQQYYPEVLSDFSDSSVGSLLVDLCAGVGDSLSFHTDRLFQETQLQNAQQRKSLLAIAATLGLKLPGKKASATVCDFTVRVPANGDSFTEAYLPVIKSGLQVSGGGKTFETTEDIDFTNPFSATGTPNRIVIPQQNSIGQIVSYAITKREVVYNGITKLYKTTVSQNQKKPFFELVLPDSEVITVSDIMVLPGLNNPTPLIRDSSQEVNRYYEVESLADSTIFTESADGSDYIKAGAWKRIPKRFISEITDNGFCKITFGGGNADSNSLSNYANDVTYNQLQRYLDSNALGETVTGDSTVFVYYRSGGGASSNVGAKVLTTLQRAEFRFPGDDGNNQAPVENEVRTSLKVINPIPAFGGKDILSTEEIRYLIPQNFASQNRCVSLSDYLARTMLMPGKFGAPFKVTAFKDFNKIVIAIIGLGADGKLTNTSTSLLATNISNFLSKFRMVNDYVEIRNGRIYNLAYDFEVLVEDTAQANEIVNRVVLEVSKFHDTNNAKMNEDLLIGKLVQNINRIQEVIDVTGYKVYNKLNGVYSSNRVPMTFTNEATGLIFAPDLIIQNTVDGIFEVKNPLRDVRVTIKKIKSIQ